MLRIQRDLLPVLWQIKSLIDRDSKEDIVRLRIEIDKTVEKTKEIDYTYVVFRNFIPEYKDSAVKLFQAWKAYVELVKNPSELLVNKNDRAPEV